MVAPEKRMQTIVWRAEPKQYTILRLFSHELFPSKIQFHITNGKVKYDQHA